MIERECAWAEEDIVTRLALPDGLEMENTEGKIHLSDDMCHLGPSGGDAGAPAPPPAPPAVKRERAWAEERLVTGLAWLDGPALAVACEHGPRTCLRFYDGFSALPAPPHVMAFHACISQYV